ncbi:MAG TPA: hypothetical protein VHM30_19440, partial [Gemmatimonadaceae bacterium]|nr:hypothetical protein [Gemmatimonadaceae bacterium]
KVEDLDVVDSNDKKIDNLTATLEASISRLMDLLAQARDSDGDTTTIAADDEDVTLVAGAPGVSTDTSNRSVEVTVDALEAAFDDALTGPPRLQQHPNNGAGTLIGNFVYNTVTTLFVGEKEMIRMPTWFFPAGAGPHSETGHFSTHGEPTPLATFRFAEPIFIDKQQNFRVEIEIPDQETFRQLQRTYGPLRVWVVIDGYMTRDVQ